MIGEGEEIANGKWVNGKWEMKDVLNAECGFRNSESKRHVTEWQMADLLNAECRFQSSKSADGKWEMENRKGRVRGFHRFEAFEGTEETKGDGRDTVNAGCGFQSSKWERRWGRQWQMDDGKWQRHRRSRNGRKLNWRRKRQGVRTFTV